MRTEQEIREKIKQLEEYLTGRETSLIEEFSFKETRAFIGGLKFVLEIKE